MVRRSVISYSLWAASVATLLFLFWISSTFGLLSYEPDIHPSYHAMLADAFLNGQLHLLVEPPADLLTSPNPYDPYQRGNPYGYVWDASFYKGRYFLYFGAVPTLLFYLPCKVLFGFYPTDDVVITLLSLATIATLFATCLQVAKRLLHTRPPLHPAIWLLYIAAASSLAIQLGGGVWVIAALSGMFFQVVALGGLLIATSKVVAKGSSFSQISWAFFAGCSTAAAIGSRPTHLLLIPAGVLLLVGTAWRSNTAHQFTRTLASFLLPVGLGCLLLGWYNYARFDDVFEFGQRYQLGLLDFATNPLCSLERAIKNPILIVIQSWYLFFQPIYLSTEYPFLNFDRIDPTILSWQHPDYIGTDAVTGLLFVSPLLIPGLLAAATVARRGSRITRLYYGMNLLVAVTILAYLHTCIFAAARFLFEILSVLLIITLPALWHVCSGDSELSPQQRHKPLTTTTWRAITYFGVAVGLCIGLAGSLGGHFKKGPDTLLFFQQLVGLPVPPATDEPLLPL